MFSLAATSNHFSQAVSEHIKKITYLKIIVWISLNLILVFLVFENMHICQNKSITKSLACGGIPTLKNTTNITLYVYNREIMMK